MKELIEAGHADRTAALYRPSVGSDERYREGAQLEERLTRELLPKIEVRDGRLVLRLTEARLQRFQRAAGIRGLGCQARSSSGRAGQPHQDHRRSSTIA
jgi:hypothetical protein